MKKLLLLLLVGSAIPALAQDSVADAARASKQKQAAPKKVVTDDDMPSTRSGGGDYSAASSIAELGGSWESDLNRVRSAYQQLCNDPSLHNAKTLPPEKQRFIDEAMEPLRMRISKEEDDMKIIKARVDRLGLEEQTEIAAAGRDEKKVAAIHERYEQMLTGDKAKVAETLQRAAIVYKAMQTIASECVQPGK